MNNRLYIVEGLPCSGKSTTSSYISELLKKNAVVHFYDEGSGNHPADYEFHAFIPERAAEGFSTEDIALIKHCYNSRLGGYIVPLADFQGELFNRLLKYKIYDFLPWQLEMSVMLEKWLNFSENCDKEAVYVFNCVFLQNPMCETMMRFGFSEEQSYDYISKIDDIVEPLKPVIIYLRNDDISESVKSTAEKREGWLDGVIDYHVNGAYGKSINAQGFDGYIKCLEERQRRELSILSKLSAKSIVIENAHRDWSEAYKTIENFIVNN